METATAVSVTSAYRSYSRRKVLFIVAISTATILLGLFSMVMGSAGLSPLDVIKAIVGRADKHVAQIVINIRLIRVLAAIISGINLSLAGCVMQSVLRNPLASDYTLGVSQGAAFGAALAIVALGAGSVQSTSADAVIIRNPYLVTVAAFVGALSATLAILLIVRYRGMTPEAMILAGIAFGSIFSAGTVIIKYFATDVQVASIVFWTFGDVGRVSWQELAIMGAVTFPAIFFFMLNRWNYNALLSGDDVAISLGINVRRTRMLGMFFSSLITAVVVSFMGIIAFLGLVSSHLMRRTVGNDYRYLIPASCAMGSFLLLGSDTLSRTIVAPVVLPVGAITSFMGGPLFLYMLAKGNRRI